MSIEDWKMTYLFISPAGGILSYNNVWQKNQNANSGDKVFSIVASQTGGIISKINFIFSRRTLYRKKNALLKRMDAEQNCEFEDILQRKQVMAHL